MQSTMLKIVGTTLVRPDRVLCRRTFGCTHLVRQRRPPGCFQRRFLQGLTKRQLAHLEDYLHASIATNVQDPVLDRDLKSLDWLHRRVAVSSDGETVQLLLRLPTLLHPELPRLKELIRGVAEKSLSEWSASHGSQQPSRVNVEAIATAPRPAMAQFVDDADELLDGLGPGLAGVAHAVAVYSCKGGVGKSTVAVNLAYELARRGGRVGLLDLDVYGPSLPVLVRPSDTAVRPSPLGKGMVYPIQHEHVKLLSLGYVNKYSGVPGSGQENGASIMRGPLAGKVVSQLLKGTDWGELDVLVLDLPPGTGDVQLQVLQELQVSCSVAVTTPSKLAVVDTRKGIEMFASLGVPTAAVVENMSYFRCEGGAIHYPFGRNLTMEGIASADVNPAIIQLPISELTNAANDDGEPVCLLRLDGAADELVAFEKLADVLSAELLKLQFNMVDNHMTVTFPGTMEVFDAATLHLSLDKADDTFTARLFADSGAIQRKINAAGLRARDPKTGKVLRDSPFKELADLALDDDMVKTHRVYAKNPSLQPTSVKKRGRYGYAVQWSDGATIIYSMQSLTVAAGGHINEKQSR